MNNEKIISGYYLTLYHKTLITILGLNLFELNKEVVFRTSFSIRQKREKNQSVFENQLENYYASTFDGGH
jgi:hypothetical protein